MDTTTTNSHNSSVVPGDLDLLNRRRDSLGNVSPLEQEVLDEYERLAGNMERLSETLTLLTTSSSTTPNPPTTSASSPPPAPALTVEIAESLRQLERKVASVYTLLKASVYSIVLQQGEMDPTSSVTGNEVDGGDDDDDDDRTGW